MRTRHGNIIAAIALLACVTSSHACRLFGSYQFVEDKTGNIWFTEGDNNAISRLAPDGTVTAHPLPTPATEPTSLAHDRKGNIWFAGSESRTVGRLGRDGRIIEYPVGDGMPYFITVDHRGEAWFTQSAADHDHGDSHFHGLAEPTPARIGRIDRSGRLHAYVPKEGKPTSIAVDDRNRVWVTLTLYSQGNNNQSRGKLARLNRDGRWKIIATWDQDGSCPARLRTAPGGGVVFADGCRGVLAKVTTDGGIEETRLPPGMTVQDMSFASDGRLWFSTRKHIGYFAKDNSPILLTRPTNDDSVFAILVTRSGDVIYSEGYNYNINRLTKGGEYIEHLINIDERKGTREVKEGDICYVQFGTRIAAKAEMDTQRAEEVKSGRFKPDGNHTEKLVEQKCLVCHDARRLLLSRRSDWSPNINRMHTYRKMRNIEPLTQEETIRLVHYFNENYGLK